MSGTNGRITEKYCRTCRIVKDVRDFTSNGHKYGWKPDCKECRARAVQPKSGRRLKYAPYGERYNRFPLAGPLPDLDGETRVGLYELLEGG